MADRPADEDAPPVDQSPKRRPRSRRRCATSGAASSGIAGAMSATAAAHQQATQGDEHRARRYRP